MTIPIDTQTMAAGTSSSGGEHSALVMQTAGCVSAVANCEPPVPASLASDSNTAPMPAVQSSQPCFGAIVRDYAGYVHGLLRKLGVAACDTDDVAQNVFLAIHKTLPRFEGRSSLKTWVSGICRHKAGDYRKQRKGRAPLFEAREAKHDDAVSGSDPRADLLVKEHKQRLYRALEKLPHEQRETFVLYEIEELSMKEIAALSGCPVDTCYTRLRVARERIQAEFLRKEPL